MHSEMSQPTAWRTAATISRIRSMPASVTRLPKPAPGARQRWPSGYSSVAGEPIKLPGFACHTAGPMSNLMKVRPSALRPSTRST